MKKILVAIDSLQAGGGQKSLVSFLNSLPIDRYDIDLLLMNNKGLFISQIPPYIRIQEADFNLKQLTHSPLEISLFIKHSPIIWFKAIVRSICGKFDKKNHKVQLKWALWEKDIHTNSQKYDIAISYLEGFTNYYIIDKVNAQRKILWIHSQYDNLGYNATFDYKYFTKADAIITMAPKALENLQKNFPEIKKRFHILENISNATLINKLANIPIKEKAYSEFKGIKILSIGRLSEVKNFDLAIYTAWELKKKQIPFLWYIIGEGNMHAHLNKLIRQCKLENEVYLIGLRANPYQYMKNANYIITTSKYEGRSMVIDEAKILNKLIITTNYSAATDVINNRETGIICEMNPNSIANSIIELSQNIILQKHILNNLKMNVNDNTSEIYKYIEIIDPPKITGIQ